MYLVEAPALRTTAFASLNVCSGKSNDGSGSRAPLRRFAKTTFELAVICFAIVSRMTAMADYAIGEVLHAPEHVDLSPRIIFAPCSTRAAIWPRCRGPRVASPGSTCGT